MVVSIHAPVWGATDETAVLFVQTGFQSTHPCGVRPYHNLCFVLVQVFQSTHPCGVRHAPKFNRPSLKVSIHAPVWGATKATDIKQAFNVFQSTHPCGVRLPNLLATPKQVVSIHAPVWGATSLLTVKVFKLVFQSTHPCGVRLNAIKNKLLLIIVSIHAPVWGATYAQQIVSVSN
mgnify:CR=1 FL=1